MVLKKDESAYSFSLDFHGITNRYDQFITITGKNQSLKDSEDVKISKISSCEDLLLCTTQDNNLVVWNPCTGQTRWILCNGYARYHKYFLGYGNKNKACDSLKLLRFLAIELIRLKCMSLTLIHGELFMKMLLVVEDYGNRVGCL
ncbi:hypothetical protein Bca52824_018946 [Brassica carinata]|uniref:F-box associated beta-propeller type 1 domain-containing protein n=1 Tax=Brassica carinata TaxID=52824 RepID=A0A8X7VQF1_BRACI|nr:hypothetical protein Bca52824_018946 [Brassica carinata]